VDHRPDRGGAARQQARSDGAADHRRGSGEGDQVTDDHVGHPQPSTEEEIPPTRILFAAGFTGGGESAPDARQSQGGGAGAPHGEAAGVVECDRRPQQGPFDGVPGEVLETRLVQ
jgi:hypothetical protein